jgi:hypothetical protein
VFADALVARLEAEPTARVARIGGRLDGSIERGLAYTLPLEAGFPAIERVFIDWAAEHPGWEWFFGNVYDPVDGVTPLNRWK